jgi:tyrosine-specific transport protein
MILGGDKKFWVATFTLSGTIIGAGILGLPYVFSKSGYLIGLFWLLFLGGVIILSKLYLGEVILRTKKIHQLPGYAEKYLGKWGKRLMVFEMLFGVYSALLAYLIGEGQSFSQLFTNSLNYSLLFAFIFWIVMTLFLREGLRGLKKIESWGVLAIIFIVIAMFIWYSPGIKIENVSYIEFNNFFIPFGVVLFALLGFSALPEMKRELNGNEKLMKKAIFFGAFIPVIVYILFSFIFLANLGNNIPEISTLAFGKIVILLGIFTMLTSYFVLSFALRDMFRFDFNYKKNTTFILVSLLPLLIYFVCYYFNWLSFVNVLGIAGVISAGITGILIVLMNKRAKKYGERKPEYSILINNWIIAFMIIVFLCGVIIQLSIELGLIDYFIKII